ncbi:MAG: hypothetical protein A2077_04670 [Nitrospirae bacterium GWC2_46_6]|nr:MAG: hypothetical protein A2077_04670 [Nitrospirae bacterium GWC2_46_6]OGW20103.1 MAG: hypothetical protein A2Z82_05505 [Nitrospirae bacterium GWA2_46_11]OGW23748.1 MAG: hypothetical protein A2X55_10535 [Nitrospirae bacterium GWB2_47_37]HAK89346.1 hypothetical protein [Nitrospiraceae bacterium]HCL81616.1 hypothetical protein [Nitrospiraceae bacterium]
MKRVVSITILIAVSFMLFSHVTKTCPEGAIKGASIMTLNVCKTAGTANTAGSIDTLMFFEQPESHGRPVAENSLESPASIFYASSHIFTKDRPPRA